MIQALLSHGRRTSRRFRFFEDKAGPVHALVHLLRGDLGRVVGDGDIVSDDRDGLHALQAPEQIVKLMLAGRIDSALDPGLVVHEFAQRLCRIGGRIGAGFIFVHIFGSRDPAPFRMAPVHLDSAGAEESKDALELRAEQVWG